MEINAKWEIIAVYPQLMHPELYDDPLLGMSFTAIYTITDLEAFRFSFYDKHGVMLERPYISIA